MAGAAVTNMYDQYNLADFNVTERYIFNGSPYVGDNIKGFREQSPITYASQIKTPTLILSDTGDFRVTVTQSYELFHALKDNGVPVRFFAYPVGGHFPRATRSSVCRHPFGALDRRTSEVKRQRRIVRFLSKGDSLVSKKENEWEDS